MFLQPGLKGFNSQTRSISPLPSTGTYDTRDITNFNQLGSHGRSSRPFLSVGDTESPATESPTPYSLSDEGGGSYLSTSSSGEFSMPLSTDPGGYKTQCLSRDGSRPISLGHHTMDITQLNSFGQNMRYPGVVNSRSSSLGLTVDHDVNELRREVVKLRRQNQELEKQNLVRDVQLTTLQTAYNALLTKIGPEAAEPPASTEIRHTSLSRNDYPHVKFWTRKDWADHTSNGIATTDKPRGKVRSSQGINVTMLYAEGEDGKAVDGHVATDIRRYARSVWVHIANTHGAPPKWGDAGVKVSQIYRQHMYSRFPILQLCELDWKVDLIATDNYPSWFSCWAKKPTGGKDVKIEEKAAAAALSPTEDTPSKRAHDSSSEPLPKRIKVADEMGMDVVANGELPSTQLSPDSPDSPDVGFQFTIKNTLSSASLAVSLNNAVASVSSVSDSSNNIVTSVSPVSDSLNNIQVVASALSISNSSNNVVASVSPVSNSLDNVQVVASAPSVSDSSITLMQPSSDANDTGTTSAMPSSNATTDATTDSEVPASSYIQGMLLGTLNRLGEPPLSEISNVDNNTEIPQAVTTPFIGPVPVDSYSGGASGTALLPDLLSESAMNKPVSSAMEQSTNAIASNVPTVTGNSNTVLLPDLLSATDKPFSSSTEQSANTIAANAPTVAGNSKMSGGIGSKKPSKMRPGNTSTPRNICAQEWCNANPGGSTHAFKVYYDALSAEMKRHYEERAAQLKAAKA